MEAHGEILKDVEDKIACASRAFGTLCKPVFSDGDLSLKTKRMVYKAVVRGVLLYGQNPGSTRGFILGITRAQ